MTKEVNFPKIPRVVSGSVGGLFDVKPSSLATLPLNITLPHYIANEILGYYIRVILS